MKVEVIASYNEKNRILSVKSEHGVEWKVETGVPQVYLSSIIATSFAIKFGHKIDESEHYRQKYKLSIEEI